MNQIKATAYDLCKRALDLTVASAAATVTAPIMLSAALGIYLSMGPPILFVQVRPGRHERPFKLYKFRTMETLREGADMVSSDATRLTAFGQFLRATSIDELPSLINVIKGDMSLVGPRPLLLAYLDRYNAEQRRRHDVKPGVTGWAQVNGRNALSWEEKFALDCWYVDHRTFALDLAILFRTVGKVLRRADISSATHATTTEFMGTQEL